MLAKTKTLSPIGNTPSGMQSSSPSCRIKNLVELNLAVGENNSTRPLNSKIKANAGEKQLNSATRTKQLNSTGENNSTRQLERNNSTGENNSTRQQERNNLTQQEKITQLVSRNEITQLSRRK
ncbi:hypothetical protein TNCV_57351 [Trichonephila clavipes]|nr:hypothetical protein TNCV_57351 [Trichonephila clavipes]